jgi:hypothetical protein
MPLFTPVTPSYEGTEANPGVQSGAGPFGLWPRPVYVNDERRPTSEPGLFGSLGLGGLFSPAQPAYTQPPIKQAKLAAKPER